MTEVHIKTVVGNDGTLTLRGLPALAGHEVDVLVRECAVEKDRRNLYPLRGRPIQFSDPFGSVAENEWDAAQ